MNILVTGGAGYLGSILVPRLLALGHRVTVLDSFLYGQTSLLDCCHDPKFDVVRGDVRDGALVRRLVAKADAVIPLACLVGAPACAMHPAEARAINLDAVKMLAGLTSPSQMILSPTTNSGYGVSSRTRCSITQLLDIAL